LHHNRPAISIFHSTRPVFSYLECIICIYIIYSPRPVLSLIVKLTTAHIEHHAVNIGRLFTIVVTGTHLFGTRFEPVVAALLGCATGLVAGVPNVAARGVPFVAGSGTHHHHAAAHLTTSLANELGPSLLDGTVPRSAAEVRAWLIPKSWHVAEVHTVRHSVWHPAAAAIAVCSLHGGGEEEWRDGEECEGRG